MGKLIRWIRNKRHKRCYTKGVGRLFTEVGKYKPHWGTYGEIESVIGHIDLEQAVKWE